MADKVAEQKPVESTVVDDVEKVEKAKAEDDAPDSKEEKVENGDSNTENGDSKEEKEKAKDDKAEKNGDDVDAKDKCCIKRKSTSGGEAKDVTPAEGATPEKKAKLDESAEAEVAA